MRTALADTPVVVVNGPRQSGKSTLLDHLGRTESTIVPVTLDQAAERAAASTDPEGYVLSLHARTGAHTVAIDEIQLVPQLFRAIKFAVDQNRTPGRFLLTGSAQLLALPSLGDSLAGRMELIELWPLTQGEIEGHRDTLLLRLLSDEIQPLRSPLTRTQIVERAQRGGFPPAILRTGARRRAWMSAYVASVIDRDIAVLAALERLGDIPRLVGLLAARTGGVLNVSEVARDSGVPVRTLSSYITWLERVFLVHRLPAWSSNHTSRAIKSPKLHLADSGLLASYLDVVADDLTNPGTGQLLECFVAGELRRQSSQMDDPPALYHFRSGDGVEVDIVIEDRRGNIYGVEVKSSVGIDRKAFGGLAYLRDRHPKRFRGGIVLYAGTESLPFGPGFWALPIPALWQ